MQKRKWITLAITIGLTGLLLGLSIWGGNSPLLGLDLQGGTEVVLRPAEGQEYESRDLDQAREIISRRVDGLGVAEPDITRQGSNIVVQLPGVEDQDRAIDLIGQTAELTFRPVLDGPSYVDISLCSAGASPEPPDEETDPEAADAETDGEATEGEDQPNDEDAAEQDGTDTQDTIPATATTITTPVTTTTAEPIGPVVPEANAETPSESQISADDPVVDLSPDDLESAEDTAEGDQPLDLATGAASDPETALPSDTVIFCQIGDQSEIEPSDPDTPVLANLVPRFLLGPAGENPSAPLTGAAIQTASATFTGVADWYVSLNMKAGEEGIDRFNALAARCFSGDASCPTQQMAIVLDGNVESAPTVNAPAFQRDQITITGGFSERDARDLALVLRYGALPIEFDDPAESGLVRTVSATLGRDSLRAGVIAAIVGLTLVTAYMIAYYRLLGLLAVLSLALSGTMLWVVVAFLSEWQGLALTLAGITGLIVSLGVSLDSNVVYFENLKEGVVGGRTLQSSVSQAFPVAFKTIFWANLATLIGAIILWLLTVGSVRGFAIMLAIASVLDLLATYFFLRPAVRLLAGSKLAKPFFMGMPSTRDDPLAVEPAASVT